jgi:hypothetical protein
MPITRIVSGGQTGADRGGLEAALYCRVPYGGWIPKGRRAEKRGKVPAKYEDMQEMPTVDYRPRTEANAVDSCATVVFTFGSLTRGSRRTIVLCRKHRKPYRLVNLSTRTRKAAVKEIVSWLRGHPLLNDYKDYQAKPPENCVLNVAGSPESKADGIEHAVKVITVDVLREVNPECRKYPPMT